MSYITVSTIAGNNEPQPPPPPRQPTSTTTPAPPAEEPPCYVAKYYYHAMEAGDLSFAEGDELVVVGPRVGTWWLARNTRTGLEGYVPTNFIATKQDGTLTCQEPPTPKVLSIKEEPWYFGELNRTNAEKLLKEEQNDKGSFLVRDSQQTSSGYALSVRLEDTVKHFVIYRENGSEVYLSKKQIFPSVTALVAHYQKPGPSNTADATAGVVLVSPCKRKVAPVVMPENDQWEIDRECLEATGETLGEGQFGLVYKARWNSYIDVAVKALKDDCMDRKEFMREAQTMKRLRHPRLVKLLGLVTKPSEQPLMIVTEVVMKGSLLKLLRDRNKNEIPLSLVQLADVGRQVASGMAYLEGERVIHRDLAARNVLVGDNLQVKISDFGLARFIKGNYYLNRTDIKFPVKWTAPEALISNLYTSKSDVWSFGILLYELYTHGGEPYPGMKSRDARHIIQDGEVNRQPPGCPFPVYATMLKCWIMNPRERPSFAALKHHLETLKSESA